MRSRLIIALDDSEVLVRPMRRRRLITALEDNEAAFERVDTDRRQIVRNGRRSWGRAG